MGNPKHSTEQHDALPPDQQQAALERQAERERDPSHRPAGEGGDDKDAHVDDSDA